MKQKIWLGCLAFAAGLLGVVPAMAGDNVVNLYSARHYESDKALYEAFTKKTGIRVNVVSGKAPELIERIKREGQNTQADVFITVDGGVLNTAKKAGILQAMPAGAFSKEVPGNLRDREDYWVGLTTRARVIVYSKERVKPEELSTYEDLAGAKWKGRVLVRSSADLYDQSLLASLIAIDGYEEAEKWAAGIVANMARQPRGNDRAQAKAIAAGEGDVAIMNTYYIGQMLHSKDLEEVRVAKNTGVFFPNQKTTGTHINISGAGLTKYGKNRENAMKLIGYLLSVPAQEALSNGNYEYPVNPKAQKHKLLDAWGSFRTQQIDFSLLGENNPNAIRIFNKVGWK
ncbi:Fe(3+) ABC transporter substrate-binding protein [Oxalobacter vibrioformis]|uniref:Fe(3+) ABC transporter substrate-binding protein n=1 Tax=Oxalobacter vibrioformis TaxID=933080 RepID=A0A9E9LTT4_9BURK|nr:Fe(3+) ABC transporter substrate-binding protein [Oxalobacter vibrioformis]NLC22929.1 Fe(3+) ABC transporter substrate-binding protein [Oxalobacter sp.]WAW09021.1 Fe(3+) ABC transporter substrate-binding protein [Oxalobacter vibrioformis]